MKKKLVKESMPLPNIDLSGGQSVRANFRMSQSAYDAIDWLTKYNKITAKELFDRLFKPGSDSGWLVTEILKGHSNDESREIRKTQVISRSSLQVISKQSMKYSISRDKLVQYSIIAFKVFTERHLEERKKNHSVASDKISEFLSDAELIEKDLKELLYEDDPIINRFGIIIVTIRNLQAEIVDELQEGTPIDPEYL